jgi:hypothetical protein
VPSVWLKQGMRDVLALKLHSIVQETISVLKMEVERTLKGSSSA